MNEENLTARALWSDMESERSTYLDNAITASELTLPYLYPRNNSAPVATMLQQPNHSFVVSGVQSLVNKLMLALVPANSPFFRMSVDPVKLEDYRQSDPAMFSELELALMRYEKAIKTEMEETNLRQCVSEAFYNLLVAGNALLYVPKSGNIRSFNLNKFCIRRDPNGNPTLILIRECVDRSTLDDSLKALAPEQQNGVSDGVDIFTVIELKGNAWHVRQELDDATIPDSQGTFKPEDLPYIPLRYITVDGEHYGRGLVECYIGDIRALNGLAKSLQESAWIASRCLFLVEPTSVLDIGEAQNASNGGFLVARKDDLSVFQIGKYNDLRVAHEMMSEIMERLKGVFLVPNVRSAERVTAEEIRLVAQQLEQALGSVYAILSQELQLPLVRLFIQRLSKSNRLPKLPGGLVKPVIVTGLEALGRVSDLDKLDMFLAGATQTLGVGVLQYINMEDYLKRRAAALGIDGYTSLVKPQDQVDQQQQQQQMQASLDNIGPSIVQAMAKDAQNENTEQ